jgi:hypothetical protein
MFTGGKIVLAPSRIRTAMCNALCQHLRVKRALFTASQIMEMVMCERSVLTHHHASGRKNLNGAQSENGGSKIHRGEVTSDTILLTFSRSPPRTVPGTFTSSRV